MVYVHFADGFEEVEALTAVDLLRRAEVGVEMVSIMGRPGVTGAHGIEVACGCLFEDADYGQCEMIVLPGGMPGAANLDAHAGLRERIQAFAKQGKWLAAICAAPLVFGHAGILQGRRATCYPGFEGELHGAEFCADEVCVDENIITSRGPATAIPFALALIEALKGGETAAQIAKDLLYAG